MSTQLKNLAPGQKFYHKNVCDHPNNYCTFISITKTPTGRDSFNYNFRGKICKGQASSLVFIVK